MAKNNDISITRTLMSIEKTLIKIAMIFFLLSGILLIVTINDAGIDVNSYSINSDSFTSIKTLEIDSKTSFEVYMFIVNQPGPGKVHLRIEKSLPGGGNETIRDSTNDGFLRTLNLEAGTYEVRAMFVEGEYFTEVGEYSVEIVFGTADDLNITLFGITVLFIVIFSISIGFFFALMPFTIAAVFISAFMSTSGDKGYSPSRRQSRQEAFQHANERNDELAYQETTQNQNSNYAHETTQPPQYSSSLNLFDPESYISRFTRTEWILFAFMSMFLFLFFVEFEGIGLFFALIALAVIIYRVNERERTKHRILILMSRVKETSISYLATQTTKSVKYVQSVLQIMILDEGYPIRMDSGSGIVSTLGDLSPYLTPRAQNSSLYVNEPGPQIVGDEDVVEEETATITLDENSSSENYTYCSNCGEQLPEFTKYCFICGTKQT